MPLALFMTLVGMVACGANEEEESCQFSAKSVAVGMDEKREFLADEVFVYREREYQQTILARELDEQSGTQGLIDQSLGDDDAHEESLTKNGKVTRVKIDLLNRFLAEGDFSGREYLLWLYNSLRWGEEVTDRAYTQVCDEDVVLKNEETPYQSDPRDAHFMDENTDIASKNLYYAYGTAELLQQFNDSERVYTFDGPKTGRGFSVGFFVRDEFNRRWRVKIGWEAYRETLASRLSWALGFPVDEVYHVRELRVPPHDDLEKIFKATCEDGRNCRKLEDSLAGIVTKDGQTISFIATDSHRPEVSTLFDSNRGNIQYLIFKQVIVELRDEQIVRQGQWSFDALENHRLRNVRLLGLMQFFLGNQDIKFDNNRVQIRCAAVDCASTDYEINFVVHDLGLSFTAVLTDFNNHPNHLDIDRNEAGQVVINFNTRGRAVYAWRQTTLQDAQVFAERLAQLTEVQLRQAVAASGYPYPALVLLVEKLQARRNQYLEAVAPGEYELFDVDFQISSASSGQVDIGDGQFITVPQDGFVLESSLFTNDILLGNHGRHSEMVRQ